MPVAPRNRKKPADPISDHAPATSGPAKILPPTTPKTRFAQRAANAKPKRGSTGGAISHESPGQSGSMEVPTGSIRRNAPPERVAARKNEMRSSGRSEATGGAATRGSHNVTPRAHVATREESRKTPSFDDRQKRVAAGAKIAGTKIGRDDRLSQASTATHRRTSATAGLGERGARAIYSAGKQAAHNVAQNSMAANRAVENVGRKVGNAAAKVGKKVSDTARSAERGGVRGALGKVGSALGGHAQRAINAGVGAARKVAGAVGGAAKKVVGGIPGAARKVGQAVMGNRGGTAKDRFKQAVSRRKSLGVDQDRAESFIKRLAGVTEED